MGTTATASKLRETSDQWIRGLRGRLNMTQEEFAHKLGTTVSTINRWENGHSEPSRLARKILRELDQLTAT